jgi:epsin
MVFKGTLRVVKNMTKGYSGAEVKVREATDSENVIPNGAQMSELAEMSYDEYALPLTLPLSPTRPTRRYSQDFVDIVNMLDERLNDKGKYWHVYKVCRTPTSSATDLNMSSHLS